MPRIYASNNDPVDLCNKCWPLSEMAAEEEGYRNRGNGPDGRGDCFAYDADHPDYDGDTYKCESCGVLLTEEDN